MQPESERDDSAVIRSQDCVRGMLYERQNNCGLCEREGVALKLPAKNCGNKGEFVPAREEALKDCT